MYTETLSLSDPSGVPSSYSRIRSSFSTALETMHVPVPIVLIVLLLLLSPRSRFFLVL